MRVGGHQAPAALALGNKLSTIAYRLGVPQGWPGRLRKVSPPLGFYPWHVQPVASHYTDYATLATCGHLYICRLVMCYVVYFAT